MTIKKCFLSFVLCLVMVISFSLSVSASKADTEYYFKQLEISGEAYTYAIDENGELNFYVDMGKFPKDKSFSEVMDIIRGGLSESEKVAIGLK